MPSGIYFRTVEHCIKIKEGKPSRKCSNLCKCKRHFKSEETRNKIGIKIKGTIHSLQSRKNMSEGHKNIIPWNKGLTKETDERIRKYSNKCLKTCECNKHSAVNKKLISDKLKGKSPWNKGLSKNIDKRLEKQWKTRHQRLKDGTLISKKWAKPRNLFLEIKLNPIKWLVEYNSWRKEIFKRDNYTCQICKIPGGKLEADHIIPKSYIIKKNNIKTLDAALKCKELWDINNGRTLCHKCHLQTDTYGGRHSKRAIFEIKSRGDKK